MKNEKESIRKQFENHKKVEKKELLEKSDMIDILENTLVNRNSEIERLKNELDTAYDKSRVKEIDDADDDQESDCNTATTSAKNGFTCKQCGDVLSSESCLESHVKSDHEFKCDYCEVVECTAVDLEQHEIEKHELKCEHCGFETKMDVDFDEHMKQKHGTNKRPYICDTCELTFRTKDVVLVHICKLNLKNPDHWSP